MENPLAYWQKRNKKITVFTPAEFKLSAQPKLQAANPLVPLHVATLYLYFTSNCRGKRRLNHLSQFNLCAKIQTDKYSLLAPNTTTACSYKIQLTTGSIRGAYFEENPITWQAQLETQVCIPILKNIRLYFISLC